MAPLLEDRAWALLDRVADSPTASPLLSYPDLFFDLALRHMGSPRAILMLERSLAHDRVARDNIRYDLRALADAHLSLGQVDDALRLGDRAAARRSLRHLDLQGALSTSGATDWMTWGGRPGGAASS